VQTLTIITGTGEKSRSFSAMLLGSLQADSLWEGGEANTKAIRPVWAQFGTTEDEMRPFLANFRSGRKAQTLSRHGHKESEIELLKTAGYQFATTKTSVGTVVTAFLPDLFRMDPGMVDPKGVRFVVLPPQAWLDQQAAHLDTKAAVTHVRRFYKPSALGVSQDWNQKGTEPALVAKRDQILEGLLPLSTLFTAYLDRRTRSPLIPDVRFQLQLLAAALSNGFASLPGDGYRQGWGHGGHRFKFDTDDALGYGTPLAFKANHTDLETFLAEQVAIFFQGA